MKLFSKVASRLIGQPMFQLLARIQELERQGRKIYRFEMGESALEAHPHIVEATKRALDHHHTKYVNSQGILELREAICDDTYRTLGFRPDADQVQVMPANAVIDTVIRCVADPGEEVIAPDPGFPTYQAVLNYTGIKRVGIRQYQRDRFSIDLDELEHLITDKTRLIINNSPNNPTGMVMTQGEIQTVYRLAEKHNVYLLSDEVYSRLTYERPHFSPGVFDQCRERTIILNSFSKAYTMSGWRLGYAIAPKKLVQKMALLFETVYSCAPPFVQHAGIAALTERPDTVEENARRYKKLRDLMVDHLNTIPGVNCLRPEGAIYVFANITGTGFRCREFANHVLENAGVALLPGDCFGEFGEGFVRLCFVRPEEIIQEGIGRLRSLLEREKGIADETVGLRRTVLSE